MKAVWFPPATTLCMKAWSYIPIPHVPVRPAALMWSCSFPNMMVIVLPVCAPATANCSMWQTNWAFCATLMPPICPSASGPPPFHCIGMHRNASSVCAVCSTVIKSRPLASGVWQAPADVPPLISPTTAASRIPTVLCADSVLPTVR